MKKNYYSWTDVESAANSIVAQLAQDQWCPEKIVGVGRGGLPLAVILSYRLNRPMISLDVDLHNVGVSESNLWLSEEAFGYNRPEETGITGARWDLKLRKKILVVDNVNNVNSKFSWIVGDWQSSCLPGETSAWNSVWHQSVRFAAMTNNPNSEFETDYHWDDKFDPDTQLIYPWENG